MQPNLNTPISEHRPGWWIPAGAPPEPGIEMIRAAIIRVNEPLLVIDLNGQLALGRGGTVSFEQTQPTGIAGYPVQAFVPALHPGQLGASTFRQRYRLQYNYVVGAMANGITSVEMVTAAGRAGMMGCFGAAGLNLAEIDTAIHRLQQNLPELPFGFNLIFSPNEPHLEAAVADLYLKRGIRLVSASAYMDMTLPLVLYRVKGIHRDSGGRIICPNRVIAKVSRVEVARKFFSPPPPKLLQVLLTKNLITREEAELAANVPMAQDLTAEADSGGHTDNRPALALLPTMLALRDELSEKHRYPEPICVGLGGGIATPEAAAAAFGMGAAYVLTGSVNQACTESGTSGTVRQMLAEAGQADVVMAPAADMFELGVKVQVLKRGTLFPFRAAKLYDLYQGYSSLDAIPAKEREILERDYFRCRFSEEWEQTQAFFQQRDPRQIEQAEKDPKHKMALVFRSYLGRSSSWANSGDPTRRMDYQIWCGPSMGAFNEWTRGTLLAGPENRTTVTVAMNLLLGAAVKTRCNWLRCQGVSLPPAAEHFAPMKLSEISDILESGTLTGC
ncbi:MAG: PfaD family polyunsaturated fatty acid/polyketide biosynthesis protein [Thermodesulfobacteriota bacterium]